MVIRSPHALSSSDINKDIYTNHGLKTILWSIDSRDWELTDSSAIIKHIMSRVQPGDIIVFHDILAHTHEVVGRLVDELYDRGYELLTVREAMSFPDDSPK